MKGWQIFMHSVQLVLNNLGAALRVSALLYLVQVAYQVVLWRSPPRFDEAGMPMMDPGAASQVLVLGILAVVASLWIAVAWHRYVLENEVPQGVLPRWHGSRMLGYLGRSILIAIIVTLVVMAAAVLVGLLAAVVPVLGAITGFGLVGLAAYVFLRLGVMLPGAAVGRQVKLGEAWAATKDRDGAVLILALIVIGASVLIQLPSLIGGQGTLVDLVYQIVTGWFATMIGVSVLTTLYGHYVEGRAIG